MERIDLADHPHERLRSWESGEPGHWQHHTLEIGRLADGRWYASRTSRRGTHTWAAHTERAVCDAATSWMKRIGRDWRETTEQDA